jgi:hypothetical protein
MRRCLLNCSDALYAYPDHGHDANGYQHEAIVEAFFREKLQP